jgi:alpha-tubulin suppressor-like RCC1 family protein
MPINPSPYIQYGGIWTASQQADAKAAGTWPVPPSPKLFAWGYNNVGQLGLGNTTSRSSPNQVGSLTDWLNISTNYQFTLATKTDGTLWAWGGNTSGQLGLGNTTNYSSPKQIGALTGWLIVAASKYQSSYAIKTDGTLWSWGRNLSGQLGLGNTTNYSSPKQVGSLTNWSSISAAYGAVGAVKTDGTLWMWGQNSTGQLGTGNTTQLSSPVQVGALTNWYSVSIFWQSTIAIKTDGTIWSWGQNVSYGALGLGNTTNYSSPKQIGSLTNWSKASAGQYFGVAIKTDGTLWGWGKNTGGELGLGNTTNYSSPKQIGSLTNWLTVVAGGYGNCLAIKTDGTLWGWGYNAQGQLGLGNTAYYYSPKQVGALTTWISIASGGYASLGIART